MPSETLSVRDWLEAHWHEGQRLYVVMGNASEANPLQAYYQQNNVNLPLPIWSGTPYAGWQEVMPYLGELETDSRFLDWVDEAPTQDWGWLALSAYEPNLVLEHLRSLTQVLMPDGAEVFFRHWDGRYLLPTLEHMGQEIAEVLPVFSDYWVNGSTIRVAQTTVSAAKDFPWWQVPPAVVGALMNKDPSTLIDNLMQWLREERPALYFALPEANLEHKIRHHLRGNPMDERTKERLVALLAKEATQ